MKDSFKFNLPLMGAGCGGSVLRNPASSVQATAVADALAALAEFDEAFVAGDVARVAEFMTDDYLETDIRGEVVDKKTWIESAYSPLTDQMKAGRFRWDRFQRSELKTRLLNNAVVIVGNLRMKYTGTKADSAVSKWFPVELGLVQFTHVWAMRNTAWRLAVAHYSRAKGERA